jgi:hypothetical protein
MVPLWYHHGTVESFLNPLPFVPKQDTHQGGWAASHPDISTTLIHEPENSKVGTQSPEGSPNPAGG